jgi:hypothetical protein
MAQGTGQAIAENKISDKIILPRQSPGLTRPLACSDPIANQRTAVDINTKLM